MGAAGTCSRSGAGNGVRMRPSGGRGLIGDCRIPGRGINKNPVPAVRTPCGFLVLYIVRVRPGTRCSQ